MVPLKFSTTAVSNVDRNRIAIGAQIAIKGGAPLISLIHPKKEFVLDVYLMRQNDSRSEPHHVNALGMAFKYLLLIAMRPHEAQSTTL
jgi:hypothetical protein